MLDLNSQGPTIQMRLDHTPEGEPDSMNQNTTQEHKGEPLWIYGL